MLLDAPLFIAGPDGAAAAPVLAEAGLDGAFAFEGPEDVFVPLARAAGAAELDLYSNVAIAFPRSPTHVAHTAWDLQRLSGGRFMLGLGSQVKAHVERRFGAAFDHPVDRMADFVGAVQDVMAAWRDGTKLEHQGPYWSLDLMPPMFRPAPLDGDPPPVHVAALGPRMTAMATAAADGVILHPFTTDRYLQDHSLAAIDAGLGAAARDRDRFTVIAGAIMAVGSDADEQKAAREGARANIAFYGSTPAYRGVLESVGRGELQPELRELTRNQGWDQLRGLVDDELVEQVAICGDPDEVADKLVARCNGGVDRVAMSFAYGVRIETVAALATAVRDRTR
jgi:probable F420-dependent oxidoreductase